ncbi:hypothetical protein TEA_022963 [Camellia sinensis var. sinensis]|uniref:histidine kinase n=1 Tax=Camellia sinensis var. sinensis TaxID=542762 RepID=A0A4S4DW40_CAMSN|nr:hypothetical protein TEA_022963 [Camellia sinensis var. sinensis]
MDIEVLSSMWPEDINEAGKQFNVERHGADQDMLEEVTIIEEKTIIDFKRLSELSNYSEKGLSQLAHLVKNWEYKQANADRLLREELDNLSKQGKRLSLSNWGFLRNIVLRKKVIVDKELRYRFIYNHFPSLHEENLAHAFLKFTDFSGHYRKNGCGDIHCKAGDTIGVNYMGMDVTDQILSTTNLDKEQRQLLSVMLSSGDLVLQLINGILDLSKVESGVMKLEAAKFKPREVVKHVLQTATALLQKILTLEGHVVDDVPAEVIGDVLWIRQILTNLITYCFQILLCRLYGSNAIKFTHEGKVGMKLYVVLAPSLGFHEEKHGKGPYKNHTLDDEPKTLVRNGASIDEGEENHLQPDETIVWICCDVYDTGIGIPGNFTS